MTYVVPVDCAWVGREPPIGHSYPTISPMYRFSLTGTTRIGWCPNGLIMYRHKLGIVYHQRRQH